MRHISHRRSRRVTGRALAIGPLLAITLATACGQGLTPAPSPAPAPAAPAPAAFAYAPGELHALFESRATVHVAGDTTTVTDTVVTRLHATLRLTPGEAAGTVAGTVDSVTVVAGGRAGAARTPTPPLVTPIAFTGTVNGGEVRLSVPPAAAADCSSPAGAYLAIARDLLPSLPGPLTPGTGWSETVESTTCRGGVVLTTTATHHYVVRDTTTHEGRPVTRIARTTSYDLAGSGSQAGFPVTVEGTGTGSGELMVDVAAGTLLTTTTRSTLELSFSGAGQVQRVTQDGVQSVTVSR